GVGTDDIRLLDTATRGSFMVPAPAALPQFLRNALHAMLAHRRRPVHIAIPHDVQRAEIGDPIWHPRSTLDPPRIVDDDAFQRFGRETLGAATRVAILAGSGTLESDATDDLARVAEALQIPVATTFRAKGALPEDHPLSLGVFGYAGHPP